MELNKKYKNNGNINMKTDTKNHMVMAAPTRVYFHVFFMEQCVRKRLGAQSGPCLVRCSVDWCQSMVKSATERSSC